VSYSFLRGPPALAEGLGGHAVRGFRESSGITCASARQPLPGGEGGC
jgi:hypothetical protein